MEMRCYHKILHISYKDHVISEEVRAKIQHTMEMRCYRKIQCIAYKDHVTNEETRARIQQAIEPHKIS